ncbi:D-alanyl-D-alanine carboxypeptidase family protein [Virgibacillus byunsanensis]|uniref:D-alanyl-D-alanine carboxypeptidase family protein n=1 Tax=Virgibacillus byunsanensis TaxID=570945 RepID=A0ABW3LN48_9BACI
MRYVICILLLLITTLVNPTIGQADPGVSANNAILIEQTTGRVLFEKKAHEQQPVASITKIMTAIVAIESGKMNETATVSKRAVYTEGSSIYLEQGEKMKVEDLVYGLMLRSGNDSAVAISEHIGGSVEGFIYLMNEKARWLGMTNTNFTNPHGLHSDDHYSTAYDMGLLMQYAMENDLFKKITGTTSFKSDDRAYAWQNKNRLLTSLYKYCIGGKTGFTRRAGRTLVTAAHKNDMDLIAVTLNASDDWNDHINLYEWAYDTYDMQKLTDEEKNRYKLGDTEQNVTGYFHNELLFPLHEGEVQQLNKKSFLYKESIDSDDVIGKTVFYIGPKAITDTTIFSTKKPSPKVSFFSEVINLYKQIIRVE